MARIGMKLRESVKSHGVRNTVELLKDLYSEKKISDSDISIKEMAASFMGEDYGMKLSNAGRRASIYGSKDFGAATDGMNVQEAYGATDASAFIEISGQLLVIKTKEKYEFATQVTKDMFPVERTEILTTEREPGLSYVKQHNPVLNTQQQMPYGQGSFEAVYIDKPAPAKFGEICRVTVEQVIGDRTRQIFESAESVGTIVGQEEEYRKLRVIAGLVNPFSWNGTGYNTFLTSGSWINFKTDFTFVDWNSMNTLEQLFANMLDPVTGYPIQIDPKNILVTNALKYPMRRVINATEIRSGTSNTSDNTTISANILDRDYKLSISKNLRKALTDGASGAPVTYTAAKADTVVILGDFQKALGWREVWPNTVVQAPPMSTPEFEQDIVLQIKASFYGCPYVRDPRYLVQGYNSSAT